MRAAVLGSPIAHSLSPVLHNAGYQALGLSDWSYDSHRVEAEELLGFVESLGSEWRGLSLTMPLKQACLLVADEVTEVAAQAEAANTLVRLADGGWRADNTDIHGLVAALRPVWPDGCVTAAVLGAGSTARSALLALAELGVTRATVYARNWAKAEAIVDWAVGLGVGLVEGAPGELESWGAGIEQVVISALPPRRLRRPGDRRPERRTPARCRLRRLAHTAGSSGRPRRAWTWWAALTCWCTRPHASSSCSPAGRRPWRR